ncbi:LysR family transcriptional regulator [Aestuariirhabdus sp. Z084]|uniref:LysR family transcriptional regulator n=1 Tax=Aestuariirhabdus haliotis TaxID=2918751 RepID=UPI00201B45D8|nr:LysR family transcriptional regulator [Aestuariirhabdus haliotis]MCL6416920.1 LysR family transcriptional regulator [Aestuariirhabdus haliotis]MCL6420918.1 LysR family transcriptional regulator [Aestuariirhabdus haliotis]
MNWNDLKFFLALAREGSVSGAGRLLGVKHTTVARRIQALEQQMDTRLFDRSRQGYAMTQAAENLFDQVVHLEEKVQQLHRQASHQDSALAGPLKLTIAHELANRLILPHIGTFCQRYPSIDLQLMMTTGLVDLAAIEADIAIRMTASPPDYLIGRELMKLRHGIYGTSTALSQLTTPVPVILFQSERQPPPWVTDHFEDARVVLRVNDVGSMAVAVKSGLGIAKLPCYIGDTEPELRRLDLDIGLSDWGLWMLNHVDLRTTARVRACKDYLEQVIENQRPLIQGTQSNYFE